MTDHTCSRCGDELANPLARNNNYVSGPEFIEETVEPKLVAVTPPDDSVFDEIDPFRVENTLQRAIDDDGVDTIITHELPNGTQLASIRSDIQERDLVDEKQFDINKDFDYEVVTSKEEADMIPSAIGTVMRDVKLSVEKTALVCQDCYKPDEDKIIWGVDKDDS